MKSNTVFAALLGFVAALGLSLGTAAAADVRTGLVSYWPLDIDAGGSTPDLAFGNNLTAINGETIVSGEYSNAFTFNGTSQFAGITHSTDNSVTGLPIYNSVNGYTICFWVKAPPSTAGNLNDRYLFTEGSTTSNNPLLLFQTRDGSTLADINKLDVFIRQNGGGGGINHKKSTAVVFDNTWHHVAWVDFQGNARLYVDGNLDGTSFAYTWVAGSLTLNTTAIGALVRSGVSGFATNTVMDDVALWQRVLSQDEINQVRTNSINIPAVPIVVQQPVGSTNAMGDRATFSVSAVGLPPLSYQWLSNSTPLPGQTSFNLTLTSLTASGSNVYSVIITNAAGAVTSSFAPLVVLPDTALDPSVGIVSYWPMDVITYGAATNSPDLYYNHTDLVLSNLDQSALVAGQFSNAIAFNPGGFSQGQYARRVGGTPIYNSTNYTVSFWVNGFSGEHNLQVFAEGDTAGDFFLLGTENSAPFTGLLNVKISPSSASDRKSTRTVFDSTWHHVVWVDENGKAKLYVDGALDETDFTYYRSNVVLQTTAIGALYRASPVNFFYGDVDNVAIWNRRLSFTEIQQVRTTGIPLPSIVGPVVTQPPVGSTNHIGDRTTLTVTASGTSPSYQWVKNGVPIGGATTTSLPLSFPVSSADDYTVVVTNIAGSITSTPAAHVVALADPTPNLRGGLWYYWPLDSVVTSSPTNTPDLYSGDNFVLTDMDGTALVPGEFGNALAFDGIQDYGQRVGGFPIYLTTNYTISLWINGSPGQLNKQIFAEGGATGNFFLLGTENDASPAGLLDVKVSPGMSDHKSTRTVLDNSWHNIVWVDENGKGKLYVDGTLDETDFTYTRSTNITLQATAIGALVRAGPANYFTGSIDDVAVWNRRLSWSEIGQLQSSAVPAPLAAIPPAIFAQPADQTNGIFATDPAGFSVLASGTTPSYQWWANGLALTNATNNTLSFAAVQTSDAGSYWVVVTNTAGAVTSSVARLTVIPYVPVTNGDIIKLDFDAAAAPNVEPGFTEMTLPLSGTNFGGVKVTLAVIGNTTLTDRNRVGSGGIVVDNPPALTESALYNDFIFASATSYTDGNGLSIRIERLAHSTPIGVTVWSYDPLSSGGRVSDWIETASGFSVAITNGYTFDGTVPPVHDYDCTFGGLVTSSATGVLQIEGRKDGGLAANPAVFINAIRLVANPVMRITSAQVVGPNLELTAELQYPGQTYHFDQKTDLVNDVWSPATPAAIQVHGPIIIADFPIGAGPAFYRVTSP